MGDIYKWIMMFSPYPKRFTQGVVVNLNVDLSDLTVNTVLPIDMMKKPYAWLLIALLSNRVFAAPTEIVPHTRWILAVSF